MADFNIGSSSNTISFDDAFEPYSKVRLYKDDGTLFEAGNDSGRTLTVTSPYATQAMASDMLGQVRNMSYQPFETSGTVYDPAMDVGDTLTVYGKNSAAYSLIENYGSLMTADISAPNGEQIDHEIPYQAPMERAIGYLEKAQEATEKKLLEDYNELIAAITVQDGALQDVVAGLQNYVRYDLENGSAFAGSALATKIGEQTQAAIEAYVVVDDQGNRESLAQMLSSLKTLKGDVEAGAKNYVRYDLSNNTSYASSQLFAKMGEKAKSVVDAYIVTDENGNTETFAQMLANIKTLEGDVEAGTKNYVRYDLSNNTSYASSQLFTQMGEKAKSVIESYIVDDGTGNKETFAQMLASITALEDEVDAGTKNYVRYDLSNNTSYASSQLFSKVGDKAKSVIDSYAVDDGTGKTESFAQMLTDIRGLRTDVNAGTSSYVTYDLSNNTGYATSQLFAKMGEQAQAKVEAYVDSEIGSLVSIKADLVDIAAKKATIDALTFVSGSLNVNGNIRSSANGSIEALTGTVIGKTVAASDSFTLKGEEYTAQEITSSNGTKYSVLGHA